MKVENQKVEVEAEEDHPCLLTRFQSAAILALLKGHLDAWCSKTWIVGVFILMEVQLVREI